MHWAAPLHEGLGGMQQTSNRLPPWRARHRVPVRCHSCRCFQPTLAGCLLSYSPQRCSQSRASADRKSAPVDLPYFSHILPGTALQSDPAVLLTSASSCGHSLHPHFSSHTALLLSHSDSATYLILPDQAFANSSLRVPLKTPQQISELHTALSSTVLPCKVTLLLLLLQPSTPKPTQLLLQTVFRSLTPYPHSSPSPVTSF